jgi:MATE family multidrug resistance protein
MFASIAMSWVLMVVPALVATTFFDADVYVLWSFLCVFIIVSGVVFYLRFLGGKWKLMRVIEEASVIDEPTAAGSQEQEGNDG